MQLGVQVYYGVADLAYDAGVEHGHVSVAARARLELEQAH